MTNECSRFEVAISTFMDGELVHEEIRPLFLHLAECRNCQNFWSASTKVGQKLLRDHAIVGSTRLDDRIALIPQQNQFGIIDRELHQSQRLSPESFRSRISTKGFRHWASVMQTRISLSYSLVTIALILAVTFGAILGSLRPWSISAFEKTEPEIAYVSILPTVTVIGHLHNPSTQGPLK